MVELAVLGDHNWPSNLRGVGMRGQEIGFCPFNTSTPPPSPLLLR